MIRRLTEGDREQVLDLLIPESALNLLIIGDIENNGFEAEFQELWGDYAPDGKLRAVLLRYYGSFIPYAPGEFDLDGLARVLLRHKDLMTALSGLDRVIRPFEAYPGLVPENARKRALFFVELRDAERLAGPVRKLPGSAELGREPAGKGRGLLGEPERVTADDVPAFLELWRQVEGFVLTEDAERSSRRELEQGASRVYVFREGGRVVATVKTTAETDSAAMIVGVATHPGYRRRGLATRLLIRLCRELLAEGKRPCLFYDNPRAGGIYRRLGFTDVGMWVMYKRGG